MSCPAFRLAMLTAFLAVPAIAQTLPRGTADPPASSIVRSLAVPPLDDNASPADFLRVAEGALAADRVGEARVAMEMAQTRLLDRSVPLGQTDRPSDQPAVRLISQGLQALTAGDRATCLRMIQAAEAIAAGKP